MTAIAWGWIASIGAVSAAFWVGSLAAEVRALRRLERLLPEPWPGEEEIAAEVSTPIYEELVGEYEVRDLEKWFNLPAADR